MQNCLLSGYYVLRELRPRARVVLPLPVILTRGSACGPVRAWAMLVFVRRSAAIVQGMANSTLQSFWRCARPAV